jgi:hypothetical protein
MVMRFLTVDGEIIICNLESGHITGRMLVDNEPEILDGLISKPLSVDKLLFLKGRNKKQANLVSTGGEGIVRFWNISTGICAYEQVYYI